MGVDLVKDRGKKLADNIAKCSIRLCCSFYFDLSLKSVFSQQFSLQAVMDKLSCGAKV